MTSLLKYTLRRLLAMIPILFGVLTISFILTRNMPGNPFIFILGEHATTQRIEWYNAQIEHLGLNENIWVQFLIYLRNLFTGDWGESYVVQRGAETWELIGRAFPKTVEITILAMFFATVTGIKAGITSAVNRNTKKDAAIRFMALVGVAIPVFWLGLLLQYAFAIKIQIFPATGYNDPAAIDTYIPITGLRLIDSILTFNGTLLIDTIMHLVLPIFCLSFISIAGITRYTRSSMLEVLELDYVRTARAKGCKEKTVINKHAFRNALIPTITVVGLNFAGLLGGAVLTETTFNLNAMGALTIDAIGGVDYNIINASVFLMTIIYVTANLVIDLLYGIVDPRIRY